MRMDYPGTAALSLSLSFSPFSLSLTLSLSLWAILLNELERLEVQLVHLCRSWRAGVRISVPVHLNVSCMRSHQQLRHTHMYSHTHPRPGSVVAHCQATHLSVWQ